MKQHIRESNLIEEVDDPKEDKQSMKAWEYLKDRQIVNHKSLLKTHRLITVNQLPPEVSGEYRDCMVSVGGRLCPAPYMAHQLIHNWLWDMMEHWDTLDPKEMHVRFETIHPFVDGNGRTGRMMMWWHERKQGKKPTLLKADERWEYYKWFNKELE